MARKLGQGRALVAAEVATWRAIARTGGQRRATQCESHVRPGIGGALRHVGHAGARAYPYRTRTHLDIGCQGAQQRGLAAAVGPDKHRDLPGMELQ